MESHTIKMNYDDQIEICKEAFNGEGLFNVLCTILVDVISDNELTTFDIKDLVMQINDEMQLIPIENKRP